MSLVCRMISGERTEAGRQFAVLWNSWDERGWAPAAGIRLIHGQEFKSEMK